jgi:putative membrane protein insertion efficiency factor
MIGSQEAGSPSPPRPQASVWQGSMHSLRTTVSAISRWPARATTACLIALIRVYQVTLSPLLGPACRFEPTCSRYMVESVRKYGLLKGLARGLRRISRCHPWNPGGYDPP